MTTTEFEPIDVAKAQRAPAEDRDRPDVKAAITLTHPSGKHVLADWCEVSVPIEVARARGFLDGKPASWVDSTTGRETPAVLRRQRGRQAVFFDVLAEFHRLGKATGDVVPAGAAAWGREFVLHPHLRDGRVQFPAIDGFEIMPGQLRQLAGTAAVERYLARYKSHDSRVFLYVESFVRSMDPVVTYNVSARRRSLAGDQNGTTLRIVMRFPVGCRVSEPMRPDSPVRSSWEIVTRLDWGTSPTWTLQVGFEGKAADPVTRQALDNARFGEPSGVFQGWGEKDARWLAFGVRPRGAMHPLAGYDLSPSLRARKDDYNGPRVMSQALNAGQGGAQRFGQTLGGWIFNPSTVSATLLRLAVEDELLRPVHWVGPKGESLRATDRPGYLLVDREYHPAHSRGMVEEFEGTPPSLTPSGGRTTDDVLHVDDIALAAYLALRDDCWAVEDCYRQIVEREAAAVRLQAGWATRARGLGRSLKSCADAAWLFWGEDTATVAVAAIGARLHVATNTWKGRTVVDPSRAVRPVDFLIDPRLLGGRHHGVIPYEEATAVAGLVAAAHVLEGEQRVAALGIAWHSANTVHALACRDDLGPWFAYGVGIPVGNELGQLPPDGFETTGTAAHASWVHGSRESGWTRWAIAAAYLLPYLGEALSELLGAALRSPFEDDAREIVRRSEEEAHTLGDPAELYRFSACPTALAQAEFVATAGTEP